MDGPIVAAIAVVLITGIATIMFARKYHNKGK